MDYFLSQKVSKREDLVKIGSHFSNKTNIFSDENEKMQIGKEVKRELGSALPFLFSTVKVAFAS